MALNTHTLDFYLQYMCTLFTFIHSKSVTCHQRKMAKQLVAEEIWRRINCLWSNWRANQRYKACDVSRLVLRWCAVILIFLNTMTKHLINTQSLGPISILYKEAGAGVLGLTITWDIKLLKGWHLYWLYEDTWNQLLIESSHEMTTVTNTWSCLSKHKLLFF